MIEWINTKTSNKNSSDDISDPICYKSLHNERRTTHFMRNIKERAEWRKLCSQINFMWVESFRVEVRESKIPTSKLISIKSKSITVNLFILSIVRWNEKKKRVNGLRLEMDEMCVFVDDVEKSVGDKFVVGYFLCMPHWKSLP